jgi:hypothetical protein
MKHGGNMQAFRNAVEKKCIDLASIEDDRSREEAISLAISDFREEAKEISALMRNKWPDLVLGSVIPNEVALSASVRYAGEG